MCQLKCVVFHLSGFSCTSSRSEMFTWTAKNKQHICFLKVWKLKKKNLEQSFHFDLFYFFHFDLFLFYFIFIFIFISCFMCYIYVLFVIYLCYLCYIFISFILSCFIYFLSWLVLFLLTLFYSFVLFILSSWLIDWAKNENSWNHLLVHVCPWARKATLCLICFPQSQRQHHLKETMVRSFTEWERL